MTAGGVSSVPTLEALEPRLMLSQIVGAAGGVWPPIAHGEFRQQAYEKVLRLLQAKQEAFSPSAPRTPQQGGQAGDASDGQRLDDD